MPVPNNKADAVASQGPSGIVPPQQRQALELIDAMAESFGEAPLTEVTQNILDLPPEKRFSESAAEFGAIFGVENPESASKEDLPEEIQELAGNNQAARQLMILFESFAESLQDELISKITEERAPHDPYLYLVVFLDVFVESVTEVERYRLQEIEDESKDIVVSRTITLLSYFVQILSGNLDEFDEGFLRDIIRARYYGRRIADNVPEMDIEEIGDEEVEKRVRLYGGVMAYQKQNISLSRGAELAGLSEEGFKSALEHHDISIRYDANSVEEFENGPTL